VCVQTRISPPRGEAPEGVVAGCAPLEGGRSVVAHDDHEVVVAILVRGVARTRAEKVDAFWTIDGHETGDDLGEERISCVGGSRRPLCPVLPHNSMLAGLVSVRRSRDPPSLRTPWSPG
jgi:hypothetical protein